MTAPAYSLARGRFGKPHRAKLHRLDVREIRTWARREGFGMTIAEQVRALANRYGSDLSPWTFRDVLSNRTWRDPAWDREAPDAAWTMLPVLAVMLLVLRRA